MDEGFVACLPTLSASRRHGSTKSVPSLRPCPGILNTNSRRHIAWYRPLWPGGGILFDCADFIASEQEPSALVAWRNIVILSVVRSV
jgi:hypothetical protein